MAPRKVKKVMTLPINVIFGHLQKKNRVLIWLHEDTKTQIEGQIIGFDEYMNMTLDDAVEVTGKERNDIGRILLKGDAITLLQEAS
jgi:small nuclear ribonucleoprotein E|eukprot:CAMPEP_0202494216 /NCGR_PEP_ID=MMETSP1361-20130828/11044_1 /ASSEMBLY_ACC=CAM_ASM_000849 /TAXON_ID=210615 /ORGANISM="Staurosira complex sp., Strain CCMP2646" /LENGTH=85 /DNA_ID=CAMNT_0049124643 /DNA_START=73 /DNA_END=330 /DNA_ORIENTATION=-